MYASQHKWHSQGASRPELSQAGYHRQAHPSSEETMSGAKPGSHVAVARAGGLYDHHAIYVGNACARHPLRSLATSSQSVYGRLAAHAGVARLSISACLYKVSAS